MTGHEGQAARERLQSEIIAGLEGHRIVATAVRGGGFLDAYIPELVKLGIDVAVRQFGGPVEQAIAAHRDAIRRVVSDATLAFLRGIVDELGGAQVERRVPDSDYPADVD